MAEFNRMTIVAAAQIIEKMHTHAKFTSLALEWDVADRCGSGSLLDKANSMAKVAIEEDYKVHTINGVMSLDRAMLELAITASPHQRSEPEWKKLLAGLRFDGFELVPVDDPNARPPLFDSSPVAKRLELRRMLPESVSETDFREAASEVDALLEQHKLTVTSGHLNQALSAFQRGDWAASNAQLRSFFESCLREMANQLGYDGKHEARAVHNFLGKLDPPFLMSDYNEWNAIDQKPQFLQGLWSRMHPQGSHPGLSEEDDATFRLQITLITARLFLRRFDKRLGRP